ncbi:MAG TPA: flagellar export chaperone FliS [Clostridia bacterium]|nr:flagellar export chaperone FliS [Clostridia bacterium]
MYQAQAYQAYQQNQVMTAPPEKLVAMLYEGAVRFLTQAAQACEARNIPEAHQNLIKAQNIIAELMSNVNRDVGEVGENLFLLYDFMYRRLVEANVKKDVKIILEVKELVESLRDTWQEAVRLAKGSAQAAASK